MAGRKYGGHVRRMGPTTFELRLYIGTVTLPDGKKKKKYYTETFHGTEREASERMAQIVTDKAKGKLILPDKITVGEYMDYWFGQMCETREWRPNTQRNKKCAIRHIKNELGNARLQKVGPLDIQEMYSRIRTNLQKAGHDGRATIKLVHIALRDALDQAVQWKLIADNPADAVEKPQHKAKDRVIWTEEQQRLFLVQATEYRYYPMWVLMLYTGLRVGEICGLRWSDIDMDAQTLTVRWTCNRNYGEPVEGAAKTESGERMIPFTGATRRVLQQWKVKQNEERLRAGAQWQDTEGRVFTTRKGAVPTYNSIRQSLMRACRRIGLPYDAQHALRHAFGTNMVYAGVDPKTASELMGHASVEFYMDTYVHPTEEKKRAAIQQMQNYVQGTQ